MYSADARKGAVLGLNQQNEDVRSIIHVGFERYFGKVFWEHGFPVGTLKVRFERDSVYEAAIHLGFDDFVNRISKDPSYVTRLASPVFFFFSYVLFPN